MTATQILVFVPAAALIAISPGANNLLAFSNGNRSGFWLAVMALFGRCLAFSIMIALVIAGLGALLAASELAFQIVKWCGVAYLAFLGVTMLISKPQASAAEADPSSNAVKLARQEFMVAMGNPKAVLLFTAFVPQFIIPEADFTSQLVVLGATYTAVEFVAASLYALAGYAVKVAGPSAKRMLLINRCSGALMVGAAAMLAATKRG